MAVIFTFYSITNFQTRAADMGKKTHFAVLRGAKKKTRRAVYILMGWLTGNVGMVRYDDDEQRTVPGPDHCIHSLEFID